MGRSVRNSKKLRADQTPEIFGVVDLPVTAKGDRTPILRTGPGGLNQNDDRGAPSPSLSVPRDEQHLGPGFLPRQY